MSGNNILVLVDGEILIPSMTEYFTMKDNSLTYNLAKFKSEPFVINPVDCKVYIDGELLSYSSQYVFDLSNVAAIAATATLGAAFACVASNPHSRINSLNAGILL